MSTPPPELPLIERLRAATAGRYTVHAELGVGGMATVYRATEIALEREVAIKVMNTAMAASPGSIERFRREARVAAALSHPHIVPIYAIGEDPSLAFFAMKFIKGRGLDSILKKEGAQPIDMVARTLSVVGKALNHAHQHGVVHRDVKPANIMVGDDGWVYVTDFGIAKREDAQGLTQAGTVVGTPAYMSPEQFNGAEVTGAADQYALGIVAYEMLAGRTPFDAPSLGEIMRGHLLDAPPPLRTIRIDVPVALADVVNRMLEKEPANRFPTLGDAVTALEAATAAVKTAGAKPRMAPGAQTMAQSSPTTPIPRSSTPMPLTGSQPRRTMPSGIRPQPQVADEPKKGGLGILALFLILVGAAGGGIYYYRDQIVPAPRTAPAPAPAESTAVSTPANTPVNPPVNAPVNAPAPGPATSTPNLPVDSTEATAPVDRRSVDSAVAALAARVNAAMVIDNLAPRDSAIIRVGSQMLETVLFVNGNSVGIVGGRALVETKVAPGPVTIAVKRLNCTDWDSTFAVQGGKRYTFVERSPRC